MSEGELSKRLNAHCFRCVASGKSDFEDVEKILDEAKQEFPKCSECHFYVGDGEDGHCTLDDKVDSVGCPKDNWFKKWFGDIL